MSADVDAGAGDEPDAPSTREVARALDVEGQLLARFADAHPDPSPAVILGWAEADPEHQDLVAAWLEARERERARRRDRRTPGGERR